MNLDTFKHPIAALNRSNLVCWLQMAGLFILVMQILAAIYPMVQALSNAQFSVSLLLLNIFSLLVRLSSGIFPALVIFALAEIIKLKK